MKKFIASIAAATMLFTGTCVFASPDISSGSLQVEGVGAPGQASAMGFRAATLDAYRNLLEEIGEVNVDSDTTVQNAITINDVIKTRVNGVVKGAKVVNRYKDNTGYYHVVITVPVYGAGSLAEAVIPDIPQVPFPAPAVFEAKMQPLAAQPAVSELAQTDSLAGQTSVVQELQVELPKSPVAQTPSVTQEPVVVQASETASAEIAQNTAESPAVTEEPAYSNMQPEAVSATKQLKPGPYTGVVIDCSGMGLQTTMAPGVFTADHQLVYGQQNFSYQDVISKGYVGYAKSLEEAAGRAGANPLIIKAASIYKNVSPVVSDADAALITRENQQGDFLSEGKMVFIR